MASPTYDLLDSTTLASSASSVTFSSISQDYRDLVLVCNPVLSPGYNPVVRFNGDTGANYPLVKMRGNGSAAQSEAVTSDTYLDIAAYVSGTSLIVTQIMDYSATDKHKTVLNRGNNAALSVQALAARWANTSAISSILIYEVNATNFGVGSSFHLYGIAS